MFPIHKLQELPPLSRIRKAARLLEAAERELEAGRPAGREERERLLALLDLLAGEERLPAGTRVSLRAWLEEARAEPEGGPALRRSLNRARHALLAHLQAEPAEWDLLQADTPALDPGARRVFPIRAYLEELRSPFNVGAVFRTSEAFGVERVLLSPGTPLPTHPRAARTARGTAGSLPWEVAGLSRLEGEPGVFALELGGTPIDGFPFPRAGTVLVGSEELGLSPEALRLADRGAGRVSIPLAGAKRSLNVAVAYGILLQRWFELLLREEADRPPRGE